MDTDTCGILGCECYKTAMLNIVSIGFICIAWKGSNQKVSYVSCWSTSTWKNDSKRSGHSLNKATKCQTVSLVQRQMRTSSKRSHPFSPSYFGLSKALQYNIIGIGKKICRSFRSNEQENHKRFKWHFFSVDRIHYFMHFSLSSVVIS